MNFSWWWMTLIAVDFHWHLHLPTADYYIYCFRILLPVLQSCLVVAGARYWNEHVSAAQTFRPVARRGHPLERHRWTDLQGRRVAMPARVNQKNPSPKPDLPFLISLFTILCTISLFARCDVKCGFPHVRQYQQRIAVFTHNSLVPIFLSQNNIFVLTLRLRHTHAHTLAFQTHWHSSETAKIHLF